MVFQYHSVRVESSALDQILKYVPLRANGRQPLLHYDHAVDEAHQFRHKHGALDELRR